MYPAPQGATPWQAASPTYAPYHDRSAYISVPTRHTFSQSPTFPSPATYSQSPYTIPGGTTASAVAPPAAEPSRSKTNWSPAVRDYVQRCFAQENLIKGVTREEMEMKLKKIITDAASSGSLDNINWKELQLPQQMVVEERNRALLTSQYSPASVTQVPLPVITARFPLPPPEILRKRKSSELSVDASETQIQPPWRSGSGFGSSSLESRISFAPTPDKRQKTDNGKSVSKNQAKLESRNQRFGFKNNSGNNSPQSSNIVGLRTSPSPEISGPIVGRNQKLEKNYFRLTSAPNPDDVRPLEVLRKTFELLKKKWRDDGNYGYICDQFKSLRQDLTVQHIKNEFTTDVYQVHARIALEKNDLGEYNQCQTQLRALYKQNLGGRPVEFTAYRILYFLHTCSRADMNDVLSDLTPADKAEHAIKHALEVRSALALGNYHKFFKLYLSVPNMGAYLMDMFVERERVAALACLSRSYKPDVRLRFITEELAFEHDEEAAQFLLEYIPKEMFEERDGVVYILTGKLGQIFEQAKQAAFRSVDIKGQI